MARYSLENVDIMQVTNGFFQSYDNAISLIEDADLLFQNNRYTRAFSLSHLANEEIGKAILLFNLYITLLQGKREEVNFKVIEQEFRDHKSKINHSSFVDFMFNSEKKLSKEEKLVLIDKILKYMSVEKGKHHNLKNNSLYVNFINGKFTNPQTLVSKSTALISLNKAKERAEKFYKMASREVDFALKFNLLHEGSSSPI
jgi:AbiV family abortive infection protein